MNEKKSKVIAVTSILTVVIMAVTFVYEIIQNIGVIDKRSISNTEDITHLEANYKKSSLNETMLENNLSVVKNNISDIKNSYVDKNYFYRDMDIIKSDIEKNTKSINELSIKFYNLNGYFGAYEKYKNCSSPP